MASSPVWPRQPGRESPRGVAFDWIFEDERSKALLAEADQVAPSDASVLITGETGTGKELIARYIHSRSARQNGPFVVLNCGAFSESLVDAELFGHENGAFAGAFGTQPGWFEQASGGTIFLDEINDLPLPVQNKLLRVLQEREVVRLGGRKPIPVDLRILAATTVDLEEWVREKRFRKDLYYRLNIVSLDILALNQRRGDIVPLARYFIDTYSRRLGYPRPKLTPDAERALMNAPWPGNVRELENAIHRTLLLCDGKEIDSTRLRLSNRGSSKDTHEATHAAPAAFKATPTSARPDDTDLLQRAIWRLCESNAPGVYHAVEDALFREVFRYCHYSQSETARLLGVSRNIVRARLMRLGEVGPSRKASVDSNDESTP
jgi:sigma-54 dependent transcriptional regulator